MSRAAGLFNKDFNHLCFRARISLKNIQSIDCLKAIRKEKEMDLESAIIESLDENEQAEREYRKTKFRNRDSEQQSSESPGINTAPPDATGGSDVILVQQGSKSKLVNRFNKPVDPNTER